jgi:integrase/recombinase XerD
MKVQRVLLPPGNRYSWLVLDNEFLPVQPILAFLQFLSNLGRSPNTIRNTAHHLKLYWEFLYEQHLDWTKVNVEDLAKFIAWLRNPQLGVREAEEWRSSRTNATIDQMLSAVHGLYDYHARMKSGPELALYRFLSIPRRTYKPFLHGFIKAKPVRTRVVKVQREGRLVKTLHQEQVDALLAACMHQRDRLLLTLLFETGMRIGQALGLRHEDIRPEDNVVHIVPREDNSNGARAKSRQAYEVPLEPGNTVMPLYVDYVLQELNGLEVDHLPDYVFVNLWEGERGRPMAYDTVIALFRRLQRQTGIYVRPHMYRHTRATKWIYEDRLPLATASRLLGHQSIQTTHDLYVHPTPDDLRKDLKQAKEKRHATESER